MIANLFRRFKATPSDLLNSRLYDESTFYSMLMRDLHSCTREVLIESPFITSNRIASLLPIFVKMRSRGVKITILTREPNQHSAPYNTQAAEAVSKLLEMDARVIYMGGHHRKLAIIDKRVLWEGSLNILSQNDSCEIMRRIESESLAVQMLRFIKLDKLTA